MAKNGLGKTQMGIEANVEAVLCYALGWVTGLIFFLLEKDNKFVRFHAMQSIVVFGAVTAINVVLSMIFSILGVYFGLYFIFRVLWLVAMVLWVVLMVKAYQGETFKLPVAGEIAEQQIK